MTYRIALMTATSTPTHATETDTAGSSEASAAPSRSADRRTQGPSVEGGDARSITIDTLGDQGDGIAKVERGFIVIIPGTQPADRVDVEITDVKENVAFSEPVSEIAVR